MQLFKAIHRILLLLAIIGFVVTYCSVGDQNPPLGKFDGGVVLENEYIDHFLLSTKHKPNVSPSEDNLRDVVFMQAMEKIAVQEALARGLDKEPEFNESLQNRVRKIVFYRYMQQEMISRVITDSLIQEFYRNFSPQYHMKYIIRPVLKTSTAEFAQTQKDTIEYVYRLLQAGEKFEDLANKYSQDITTNRRGGDLGFVIRESLGDGQLRAVMDTLKEFTYSKPFRGYEGYYILYKGEKRIVPVPPLDELRNRIWKTLYRTRRHLIEKEVRKRFDFLSEKYHYQVFDKVVDEIIRKAGGHENTSEYEILDFKALEPEDMEKVLARYDGGVIRVAEIFADRNKAPESKIEFNERFATLADQHLLGQHGLELGIQNQPELAEQIEKIRKAVLRNNLAKIMIQDKARAKVDSVTKALGEKIKPEDLQSAETKLYFQFDRELKEKFENDMRKKYHFEYVTKNFKRALKKVQRLKLEQSQKDKKADNSSNV